MKLDQSHSHNSSVLKEPDQVTLDPIHVPDVLNPHHFGSRLVMRSYVKRLLVRSEGLRRQISLNLSDIRTSLYEKASLSAD